jgi:hypothetical protein
MANTPAARAPYTAVDGALRRLQARRPLRDESVHEARRALKKARAALKLMRAELGGAAYRRENLALRDAGRYLSPLRDSHALLSTLDRLRGEKRSRIRKADYARMTARLRAMQAAARRDLALAPCTSILKACRSRLGQADPAGLDHKTARVALKKIYRTGRAAFAAAKRTRTDDALHEVRKQAKYLFNALQWAGAAKGRSLTRARKLTDCLGEEHDLAELARLFPEDSALQQCTERWRAKLRRRAFRIAAKLYAGKPSAAIPGLPRG